MGSRGPGGQLGNSGFCPGSENSVQLERPPLSLDRAAAVTNRLWPELLNPGRQRPLPPGRPELGQEEQTPRLSLKLDGLPPRQRARFSLGFLCPLWLLEPPSQDLPLLPSPLHTGLPLCCNTPALFLAIGSRQRLPRLQRRLFHRIAGWGRGWGDYRSEFPGGSSGARYPEKGPQNLPLLASLQDLGLQIPSRAPPAPYPTPSPLPKVPIQCPSPSPAAPFYSISLLPPKSFPSGSRARGLCLCKHPPPLQSGQNSEGRGRRPPFPPVVRGASAATPGGGRTGAVSVPRPIRPLGSLELGGREAQLAVRGVRPRQVRALAGPGRAPGAGSQVTAPWGARGGPRFGPVHQPRVGPGAYNGRCGREKTQSAAGLPGLLPPPPAPRACCMRAR